VAGRSPSEYCAIKVLSTKYLLKTLA